MMAFDILEYEVPRGWDQLVKECCDEVALRVEELGLLDDYVVFQVKEKYGELRWYDNLGFKATEDIIQKYAERSRFTCCECGAPAEWETTGYVCPYCEECIEKVKSDGPIVPIEEYYNLWD